MSVEQDIVDTINKKYPTKDKETPASCILDKKEFPEHKIGFLSTGTACLDYATGRGVPFGRLTEISGWESTGKSALGAYLLAENQRRGGISVLLDTEYAMLPTWATTLGINSEKLVMVEPEHLQDAIDKITLTTEIVRKKDVPCCIVWDSVSGMPTKEELETEENDATAGGMMLHSRILSRGMRKIGKIMWDRQIALVVVSQLREKPMQMYGAGTSSIGGHAIPYHSALRLQITKKGPIYGPTLDGDKGDPIGISCRIKVIKNKLASPFKEAFVDLVFEKGFDQVKDMLFYGLKLKVMKFHKGGWYEFKGKKYREKELNKAFSKEVADGSLRKEIESLSETQPIGEEETVDVV